MEEERHCQIADLLLNERVPTSKVERLYLAEVNVDSLETDEQQLHQIARLVTVFVLLKGLSDGSSLFEYELLLLFGRLAGTKLSDKVLELK